MTFIVLDDKDWCKGVYHRGELHFGQLPTTLSKTWNYISYLDHLDVEYASIYAEGKSIEEVCPDHLKQEWQKRKTKLKAFHNSFVEAKVCLKQNCFFDLVPQQFLLELCETKAKIVDHVLDNYKRPDNYQFMLDISKLLEKISEQNLNIDLEYLRSKKHETRARTLYSRLNKIKYNVKYKLYGSKTGRLTTAPNTFPILNIDSKYRSVIKPNNDLLVELDYNSAEARVLLGLAGLKQPQEDIHKWNAERLSLTREEAKTEFFAWLYGSKQVDSEKYNKIFNLDKVLYHYYKDGIVTNFYNRKIESDHFHSMNYLVQSTTNDLVLRQLLKISDILKNKKSFISFVVHDSIVIDLAKEDKELIKDVVREFSETEFGTFPVNLSAGKDYGNLRKI